LQGSNVEEVMAQLAAMQAAAKVRISLFTAFLSCLHCTFNVNKMT
jgi:hypothetical protein